MEEGSLNPWLEGWVNWEGRKKALVNWIVAIFPPINVGGTKEYWGQELFGFGIRKAFKGSQFFI